MRFGLIHRVMTNALASLGVIALMFSGDLSRGVNIAIGISLIAALLVPESWQENRDSKWPSRLANAIPLALLSIQIVRAFFSASVLELAIEFAVGLQISRLAFRRGAAHDQQVIVLALLHLVAGTVLGGNIGYGICFLGFLVVAPGALVLSHLRREVEGNYRQGARDRTGLPVDVPRILKSRRVVGRTFLVVTCLLSVPILVFTTALFVMFPRISFPLLLGRARPGERSSGYSETPDLSKSGAIRDDPTPVMRVEVSDLPTPPERVALYLRGGAQDYYDGVRWSRSIPERRTPVRDNGLIPIEKVPVSANDRRMRISLVPIDPPALFLPQNTIAIQLLPRESLLAGTSVRIDRGIENTYYYRGAEDRGVSYEAVVARTAVVDSSLSGEERMRYLQLPALPGQFGTLANGWVQSAGNSLQKAKAIEEHLKSEFRYDNASESAGKPFPVEHFLFESKRGHCEFYSTAMVLLLRSVGVPSRNVTGFLGGAYNRFGKFYAVRQSDAHSWVEAYIDGQGWMTFDPTPPADPGPRSDFRSALSSVRDFFEAWSQRWDYNVVGYNLEQQRALVVGARWRFDKVLGALGLNEGQTGNWVTWMILAGVGATGAYALWRQSKKKKNQPLPTPEELRTRDARTITALYESLEMVMASQGIARPQGVTPLKHAECEPVSAHPCAEAILSMTQMYLQVRFGGESLDEERQQTFAKLLQQVKQVRGWHA